jgi:hypothetical protein
MDALLSNLGAEVLETAPDLSVLANENGQVLIFPLENWHDGLPSALFLQVTETCIEVFDRHDTLIGQMPLESLPFVEDISACYVAANVAGILKHQTSVPLYWRTSHV